MYCTECEIDNSHALPTSLANHTNAYRDRGGHNLDGGQYLQCPFRIQGTHVHARGAQQTMGRFRHGRLEETRGKKFQQQNEEVGNSLGDGLVIGLSRL